MMDERLQELASLYALNALSASETHQFENELRGNAELRTLVAELRAAANAFAGSVPLVQPPPALKQQILLQINQRQKTVSFPTEKTIARQPVIWLPWAIAACLAVLCVVLASRENSLRARNTELNQLAESLQSTNETLEQTVSDLQETNRIASLRIAMLGSLLTDQPKAVAVSLWDDQTQTGVFVVENLKPLPKDKDYQLWVIDPQYGTPVDAGVFQVDDQGKVRLQFRTRQAIKTANKFAVTEEVKGGSPTPKGTMVLIGD
jgi:anti-sigma-K factor RskA